MPKIKTYSSSDVLGIISIYPNNKNTVNVRIPVSLAKYFTTGYVCFDYHRLTMKEGTTTDIKNYKLTPNCSGYNFGFTTLRSEDLTGEYEVEFNENKDGFLLYKI